MKPERTICYTLDLEHDYAGPAPIESYEALANPYLKAKLEEIIVSNQLRLTVFATGKILENHPEYVEFFQSLGAEIELHGYEHTWIKPDLVQEKQPPLQGGEIPSNHGRNHRMICDRDCLKNLLFRNGSLIAEEI